MANIKQYNNSAVKTCLTLFLLFIPSLLLAQSRIDVDDVPQEKLNNMHTIQLGAFNDKASANKHARTFNLDKDKMATLYIKSKQQYWYILVYGIYDSGREAIQQASQVCSDNNHSGCWARKVSTLDDLARQALL